MLSLFKPLTSLLQRLGRDERVVRYDAGFELAVKELAAQNGHSEEEVVNCLIAAGIEQRYGNEKLAGQWEKLTRRERDVAALTCLGYTNGQIAVRLNITTATVKTHLRNLLTKYRLQSKKELRLILGGWDFERWE